MNDFCWHSFKRYCDNCSCDGFILEKEKFLLIEILPNSRKNMKIFRIPYSNLTKSITDF